MHLPIDLQATIRQQVESGRFGDEVAVIREAIDALDARDRDRLERLTAKVADGFASIERGEGTVWTSALMDELEREAEEPYLKGEQSDPDGCP